MPLIKTFKLTLSALLISVLVLFAGISLAEVPGPEYTSPTMECVFTPELTALAAELDHDPVKIFKWVYDNIKSPKPMFKDGSSIYTRPFYTKSRLGAPEYILVRPWQPLGYKLSFDNPFAYIRNSGKIRPI